MPARSASAGNANSVGRRGLIQWSHRHGLGRRDGRKTDADRKQERGEYLHGLSFLLVREKNSRSNEFNEPLPMAVVTPVMTAPVTVTPAPMAVVPVTVPTAMPAHLFRLDVINVVLRYDSGLSAGGRGHRR
jgi:hypothetical protein